ncbi:MAG: acyl-CoA dehydrogenase family protein [Deltaproteobacteria bacterium]|uniref:Acyl-CoA dehydrogenase family protein n=1 Tax=Candidatus Desulfacyla euxinica TaxID=2841693 RepID=A0A8J6N0H0_9DELT|nr:acyl-CoA dehydrogenase family protein [Candidatus Desulfacyla euxinica]
MTLCYQMDEKYEMIRMAVREFAESEIKPVAGELDEKEEFSVSLTQQMGDIGLFGMVVPEEYGGQGLDYISYIIAMEEVARVDGSQAATLSAGNSLGISPIDDFGSEAQRRKYLPDLCQGRTLMGFGLTEPNAGSDAGATNTTADRDGDSWIIRGRKTLTTNADTPMTKGSIIQTVTGVRPNGKPDYTCFIVENGTPGFTLNTLKRKLMWRASNTAEIFLDNCRVSSDAILGNPGDGFKQMLATLDGGRLSIGAMGLGCAQGAYEAALRYSKERIQFGRPICKQQSIAFKLADMELKIELARNLLYKACWLCENKRPFGKEAAMSKLYCSEIAREVADEAVQIHGGYGLFKDYDVERFYRDQRLLQIGEGTSEILRLVISRAIGC